MIPLQGEPVCPVDECDRVESESEDLEHKLFHVADLLKCVSTIDCFLEGINAWDHPLVLLGGYQESD